MKKIYTENGLKNIYKRHEAVSIAERQNYKNEELNFVPTRISNDDYEIRVYCAITTKYIKTI
jgi:hypothetical protein